MIAVAALLVVEVTGYGESNPFDDESSNQNANNAINTVYAAAFGTESGSLHYRMYPPPIPTPSSSSLGDTMDDRSRDGSYNN